MKTRDVPKFILCPDCHQKYNDFDKRRIIDSCGHPRCFSCLCKNSICPLCTRPKQKASIGTRSPDGSETNGFLRWQPRSASVSTNVAQQNPLQEGRSKSLLQLNSRSRGQQENLNNSKGGKSNDVAAKNNCLFSSMDTGHSTEFTQDNPIGDVIETKVVDKENVIKMDRKMSFSSILNRNSESYKRSRFRRASSFSFAPKDNDMVDKRETIWCESKLQIRNRPRPKSLNIMEHHRFRENLSLTSPLSEDGTGTERDPTRRPRMDSVVRMAAAWLEESKSLMQHQQFSEIPNSFEDIKEESTDAGAGQHAIRSGPIKAPESSRKCEETFQREAVTQLETQADTNEGGSCKISSTCTDQSNASDTSNDSGSVAFCIGNGAEEDFLGSARSQESPCEAACDEAEVNPNAEKTDSCSDAVITESVEQILLSSEDAASENESYLSAIRGLLDNLKKPKTKPADEDGTDSVKSSTAKKCNEDARVVVDASSRTNSPRRFGTCVNPFLELEKVAVTSKGDKQEIASKAAVDSSELDRICTKGKRTVNSETPLINSPGTDQRVARIENHSKTNNTVCSGDGDSSDKQLETWSLASFPQSKAPADRGKRNSCRSLGNKASNDQLTSNEVQSTEAAFNVPSGSHIRRAGRARSFSCRSEIKVTMTEIQYLPSLKKNRKKRPSSVGTFTRETDNIDQLKGTDVDVYDEKIADDGDEKEDAFRRTKADIVRHHDETQCSSSTTDQRNEKCPAESLHGEGSYPLHAVGNIADSKPMQKDSCSTQEDMPLTGVQTSLDAAAPPSKHCPEPCDVGGPENSMDSPSISKLSLSIESSSNFSQIDHGDSMSSCLDLTDRVEEILSNKTDDWKTANFHILSSTADNDSSLCSETSKEHTDKANEGPVVFINREDFSPVSFKEKGGEKKPLYGKKVKKNDKKGKRDRTSSNSADRTVPNHSIQFLRETFHKLTNWSRKGEEVDSSKGRTSKKSLKERRDREVTKKRSKNRGFTNGSNPANGGAKSASVYDANRNVVMTSGLVEATKAKRRDRCRKADKDESCCVNKTQSSSSDWTVKHSTPKRRGSERSCGESSSSERKLNANGDDEASLTTVSTLLGTVQANDDSDSDSSLISAGDSSDSSDSSDSTLSGHLWQSSYSTSSDTINESVEEKEMPDFRSPSRIQDDLAALFERKVTRKRQGLEEIDFHPLMPATKGKVLVSRDWIYERFYHVLSKGLADAKRVLLLSGSHGCGKTTFLKSLIWSDCIRHGKARMRERISKSVLSFHFCSEADANTTSVAKFILNMATHLVENTDFSAFTRSLSENVTMRSALSCEAAEQFPDKALKDGILKPLNKLYGFDCNQGIGIKRYLILVDSLDHECSNCRPENCLTLLLRNSVHLLPSWITLVMAGTKEGLKPFQGNDVEVVNLDNVANWDIQSDLYSYAELELPILTSQITQSKVHKLVDNIVRFSQGSFQVAHMSIKYLSSSFASATTQPSLHSLTSSKLVSHLFKMKFCATERSRLIALSLLDVLLVARELLTVSNLFKTIESSCSSQTASFQEYESCLTKLLELQLVAESTEGRIFLNSCTREWIRSSDGLKSGFISSNGHNLLSVYYMKTLTSSEGKHVYLLAYHLSQSNFGEDITDKEKRINYLAWTLSQVFKHTTLGFMEPCNIYRPDPDIYHLFLHTELDMKEFQRRYGSHPVVVAASLKQVHVVALLLEHGKCVTGNLQDALKEASRVGCEEIIDSLLVSAFKPSSLQAGGEGTFGRCLDLALENGHLTVALKLVEFSWKTSSDGCSEGKEDARRVFCKACLQGRLDVAKELFGRGYVDNVDTLDSAGNAPLVSAASRNQLIVAKYIVENGGDVNIVDGDGYTALLSATKNAHTETSEWLISQDANVNVEDKDGRTPLLYSAASDLPQLVHSLFMEGAVINHQDHNGWTALSIACKNGCKDVVKTLLMNRAMTDIADRHAKSPLNYACLSQNLRTVQLLLDHGANINHKNGKGQKPLEIVLKEGYLDVAALLLRYGAQVGRSAINLAENNIGSVLCLVSHLEQRGNIMIKAGKFAAANEDFQRALNIIENSRHRNNKRILRIKLLCQQDARNKFI